MSRPVRAFRLARLAVAAAPALLTACAAWRPAELRDEDLRRIRPQDEVRVLRTDGATFTLTRVGVAGDTLAGELLATGGLAPRRVAVPLAQVQRVETRRVDPARTAGAVVGGAALATLLVLAGIVTFYLLGGAAG